jgi:regulator of replication initiation timing
MKQQTQIKKLSIIEKEIRKLINENEKLKAENKKLREKLK